MNSVNCSLPSCRRFTRDISGRCHDHRPTVIAPRPGHRAVPPPVRRSELSRRETRGGGQMDTWLDPDGRVHREDGPAVVKRRRDGSVEYEEWRRGGLVMRPGGGPTTVSYHSDGSVYAEVYTDPEGRTHRLDGPARTEYFHGKVEREEWHVNGVHGRDDGPGSIRYRLDGSVVFEEWVRLGKTHRIGGPAFIRYTKDGEIEDADHFLRGTRVAGPEAVVTELRGMTPQTYRVLLKGRGGIIDQRVSELSDDEVFAELATPAYAEVLGSDVDQDAIRAALEGGVRTPEGVCEVVGGAPAEWVRSFEESRS